MANTDMTTTELKNGTVTVTFQQGCSLSMRQLSITCGDEKTLHYLIDPIAACQAEQEGWHVCVFIEETLEKAGSNSLVGVSKYLPNVVERWVVAQLKGEKPASDSVDANTLLLEGEKPANYQGQPKALYGITL